MSAALGPWGCEFRGSGESYDKAGARQGGQAGQLGAPFYAFSTVSLF